MELDEETMVFLLISTPLPLLVFLYKFFPSEFFLFPLLLYLAVGVVVPVYLNSRNLSVYQRAQLIAWLKMVGNQSFTPKELELINKALGRDRTRPVRPTKNVLHRHWKKIYVSLIIASTLIVFALPTTLSQKEHEQTNPELGIKVLDASIDVFGNQSILTLIVYTRTVERFVYLAKVKITRDNETFTKYLDSYLYDNTYKILHIPLNPVEQNDVLYLQFKAFPEEYSFNYTLKVGESYDTLERK